MRKNEELLEESGKKISKRNRNECKMLHHIKLTDQSVSSQSVKFDKSPSFRFSDENIYQKPSF